MKLKNHFSHLTHKFNEIAGFNTGIVRNFSVYEKAIEGQSGLNIVTGSMPPYTKLTISPEHDMSYHISGYGLSLEEAYIRFIGESTERYASVISHSYLKDFIIKGSYESLSKDYKHIMEPEGHLFLTDGQLEKMSTFNEEYKKKNTVNTDSLSWVLANSIKYPGEKVLVPASQFFVGFTEDGFTTPSFTTGCACHETIVKAMINSIIEYVQIDAFMYHWYTNASKTIVKMDDAPDRLKLALKKSLGDHQEKYEILIIDYSDVAKVNVPIVGVFIISKKDNNFPAISFGVQGGLDLETTIYRGVQEALAVLEMNTFVPFNNPNFLHEARNPENPYFDLDTNVSYFGLPEKQQENYNHIMKHVKKTISYKQLKEKMPNLSNYTDSDKFNWLCKSLSDFSELACYLDITPPNLASKELNVSRVFIPELMHMSFPKFPYLAHERFKGEGIRIENYPHPLP